MSAAIEFVTATISAGRLAELGLAGFAILSLAGLTLALVSARASAAQRHAVLAVALASLLLLPAMEMALPRWEAGPPIPIASPVASPVAPVGEGSEHTAWVRSSDAGTDVASQRPAAEASAQNQQRSTRRSGPAPVKSAPRAIQQVDLAGATDLGGDVSWAWILSAIWALGTLISAVAYGLTIAARSLHFRRGWKKVVEPAWLCALDRARSHMNIERHVRLRWGPHARVPVTWGALRPVVVLPEAAREWGAEQRDAALLHELAHIVRGDHATQTVAQLACVLHWFNPLAWWAADRLREEAERASDDRAAQAVQSPTDYAFELVRVARHLKGKQMRFVAGVAMARSSDLESRIDAILDPHRRRSPVSRSVSMAVIAGALLLAAPLAALSPRFVDAHAATTEPAHQDVPAKEHEPALELHVTRPGELQQETPSRDRSARSVDQAQASQEAPCIPGVSGNRAITESVRSHNGRREVFWDTQRCSLRIELEGVRFTADERTIEDIEPGGLFTMAQEGLGPDRALRVQPGSRGLEFEYRVEGDVEPFGTEAQEWLAELIPTIFRVTGVQMAERLDRILERGGTEAVFSEVRQIHSDHVAGAYLGELMNTQDLTDAETSTLFAVARAQIESDHELGQLLRTAWRDDLSPAARSEYMDAAQTLESDHELAQVIHSLLEASLSLEEGATVLALAATLRSDHETGGVLRALLDAVGPGVVQREAFFEVASTLESDHELGRVLKHAMDRAQLSADQARTVIDLSRTMSSDHEQGAVLKALIEVTDGQVGDPASFFEAVGQLASDHEMGSVLKLYVMTEGLPEAAVLGVLDTADALSSDHERAELLRRILDRQWPFTDAVQDRFVESAEGISSEYERDRTLAELGRRASR